MKGFECLEMFNRVTGELGRGEDEVTPRSKKYKNTPLLASFLFMSPTLIAVVTRALFVVFTFYYFNFMIMI